MDTILNIMKIRRTVRRFLPKPVPESILMKILQAAALAPSGAGIEGTHIIVMDDPARRRKLRQICEAGERDWVESQPETVRKRIMDLPDFTFEKEYLETAPLLLVVTTRPRDPEVPYAVESAFLAVGYMLVIIEGLGLGTVTYTPSASQDATHSALAEILNLPEGEGIQVMLPVGFPEVKPPPKPLQGIYNVYLNTFGNAFQVE